MRVGPQGLLSAGLAVLGVQAALAAAPVIDAIRLEASYNSGTARVRDADLDHLLDDIVRRLSAAITEPAAPSFRIHAITNVLPYAFSLDNGALYVSTGLLARLQNEAQLAALLALQMAPVVRHDADHSAEITRQRAVNQAIPNILLVTLTAGIAAIPLTRGERTAQEKLAAQLRLESDQLAVDWLRRAGFDLAELTRAPRRLLDTLTAEMRFGSSELANQALLEARITSLQRALPDAPPAAPAGVTAPNWAPLARRFSLELARTDLGDASSTSIIAVLDRLDTELGADGRSAFLRAEYLRQSRTGAAQLPEVIRGYETCVSFADAPPQALRELAFLYRRQGDKAAARQKFESYLKRQPDAADAPIIRGYLEAL